MDIKKIAPQFSITGQIRPAEVASISGAGFKSLVCARPDHEEPGQPSFAEIAEEAEKHGLKVAHMPVSGPLSPPQLESFREAMASMPRPMLGFCRSGARALVLYKATKD